MDDCSAELKAWLKTAAPQDAGLVAAFGPVAVRVFDAPPTGAKGDYILIDNVHVIPVRGSNAGNAELTFSVYSLTDPPGTDKADLIRKAFVTFCLSLADLPSHKVKSVLPSTFGTQCRMDPYDTRTAHAVGKVEFVTQPKPQP
jgi:hypothetical protein